jgi:pantetheine-phosphate adenylyltransferase
MARKPRIGVYPGTFDPVTLGHRDIIRRAATLVDELIIAVAADSSKSPLFSLIERVDLIRTELDALDLQETIVRVVSFEGLLVKFTKEHGASLIIRGLRAVSDFEYEFQMFGMNSRLDPAIQTVFLPASEHTHFIASRFVKEIARLGGDISGFVSPQVAAALAKFRVV